jgi:hypothetical protein
MKTTVEIADPLFERARSYARQRGQSMRSMIEDGLRLVLEGGERPTGYRLPDRSVGVEGDPNPLDVLSWQDLRDEIYGGADR